MLAMTVNNKASGPSQKPEENAKTDKNATTMIKTRADVDSPSERHLVRHEYKHLQGQQMHAGKHPVLNRAISANQLPNTKVPTRERKKRSMMTMRAPQPLAEAEVSPVIWRACTMKMRRTRNVAR